MSTPPNVDPPPCARCYAVSAAASAFAFNYIIFDGKITQHK